MWVLSEKNRMQHLTCLLREVNVVRSKLEQNGAVEDHNHLWLSLLSQLLEGRKVFMALGQNLTHTKPHLLHGVGNNTGGGG